MVASNDLEKNPPPCTSLRSELPKTTSRRLNRKCHLYGFRSDALETPYFFAVVLGLRPPLWMLRCSAFDVLLAGLRPANLDFVRFLLLSLFWQHYRQHTMFKVRFNLRWVGSKW